MGQRHAADGLIFAGATGDNRHPDARSLEAHRPARRSIAKRFPGRLLPGLVLAASCTGGAFADSSTPLLASYYDRHMAICGGDAYEWSGDGKPKPSLRDVVQVGVGRNDSYALARDGRLHGWSADFRQAEVLLDDVGSFAAGDSGVLAIRRDGTLWSVGRASDRLPGRGRSEIALIATDVRAASVGDGTNYHVAANGDLFARGNAHRGQYGDGRLDGTDRYVRVASGVLDIRSHTGHALLITDGGEVKGTGGNIHGPLGRHGLGDKAVRWGSLFEGATGIATGASHSLAIRADGSLWIWGRNESPEPRRALAGVVGAAAGSDASIALTQDGSLWQWRTGRQPVMVLRCGEGQR